MMQPWGPGSKPSDAGVRALRCSGGGGTGETSTVRAHTEARLIRVGLVRDEVAARTAPHCVAGSLYCGLIESRPGPGSVLHRGYQLGLPYELAAWFAIGIFR